MPSDGPRGLIRMMEEWDTDNIGCAGNGVRWLITADNSGTLAVSDSSELQAASVTGTAVNNMNEIGHRLTWDAQAGYMSVEMRVDLATITNTAMNIGFNDEVAEGAATLPVELSGTTFTSNAVTFVGFVFDTDATNDNWHVFMVDDNADTAVPIACLNTGIAPVANTPQTFKVVVTDQGCGIQTRTSFWVDGLEVYNMVSSIDRDVLLTPYFASENRACGAITTNIHYIYTEKSRP